MDAIISEVQSICSFLMGLLTFVLVFLLPRYQNSGKIYSRARNLLALGTALVTIHFTIQYFIFKRVEDLAIVRTVTNLVFGFPVSYLFGMSMAYLQRSGRIQRWTWFFVPLLALPAYVLAVLVYLKGSSMAWGMTIISLLYFVELVFNAILMYRGHLRILQDCNDSPDDPLRLLVRWTKWSTFSIIIVSLGFPVVIFNPDLLVRSLYGILTISVTFFYVFSFIGYGVVSRPVSKPGQLPLAEPSASVSQHASPITSPYASPATGLSDAKMKETEAAARNFEERKMYVKAEITMKEAAEMMQVSVNMLRLWLKTSEYGKFNNWITSLRLEEAKRRMLETPDISSEVLAEECGFCDRQYFQKLFIKYEGQSPSKWIKSRRES